MQYQCSAHREVFKIATIYKTESGTWKAQIRMQGKPSVTKTFRIKRDAQDWSLSTEDEMRRGIYLPRAQSEKMTIKAAMKRYLEEITPTKKESTQKAEKFRVERITKEFGQYSLASLTPGVIARYRDQRLKLGKSNSTVRLELALLGHLYSTAIKDWQMGIAYNPVQSIRKPAPSAGRDRRLIDGEEERLLKACDEHSNPFLGWVVRIALATSMRQGEILKLEKKNVNLLKRTVTLLDTKNGSTRTVPLSNKAHETFKTVLEHPIRPIDTSLLFYGEPGRDGARKPYTVNRVWSSALKRAEIEGLRFHDLRHEATSRLVEAGLSDQQVASITGHKSMQMLKRYTHLRSENLVELIANI